MNLTRILQNLSTLKIKAVTATGCEVNTFTGQKNDCEEKTLTLTNPVAGVFVPSDPILYDKLLMELADLKRELYCARTHFDFQTNFDLIEADIFFLNGLETKYNFLIKQIKAS